MNFLADGFNAFSGGDGDLMVFTVSSLLKRSRSAHRLPKDKLWSEAHHVGLALCVAGFPRQAMEIWKFVYELGVPLKSDTTYGAAAISAICLVLNEVDISGGLPGSKKIENSNSLEARVEQMHSEVMKDLSQHVWARLTPESRKELPLLYNLIDGRRFSRSWLKNGDAESLQNAVSQFRLFISANDTTTSSAGLEGCLLASELAAQACDMELSKIFLLRYFKGINAKHQPSRMIEAFCLKSAASSLCAGAMSSICKLSNSDATAVSEELCAGLKIRMESSEPDYVPKSRMKFSILYSMFYVEPRDSSNVEHSFETGNSYSMLENQLCIVLPTESARVDLHIKESEKIDTRGASHAFVVPIEVKNEPVFFIRTVDDSSDERPIPAPLGKHDLLVALYKTSPRISEIFGFDTWKIVLTFAPSGTSEVGVLVSYEGDE
ncbi:hypothetical protein KF913_07755 [Candidatus Obscuribacterales bacterium]|nr:hypothetical protein [Candidatus Obscuribacterales bacterium]